VVGFISSGEVEGHAAGSFAVRKIVEGRDVEGVREA
jgi:hypothetical protein